MIYPTRREMLRIPNTHTHIRVHKELIMSST